MIYRRNIDEAARDTFLITDYQASSIANKIVGIVPVKCKLVTVYLVYGTAAGQAGTIAIERLQGTETSGNGDHVVTGLDLYSTANTVQKGTIVTTGDIDTFEAGDRVGVHLNSGASTSCATMVVSMQFRPIDS